MDRGAHFYRCDFQVHTPRDLNWEGAGAVSSDERKAYSEELIRDCRQKGIDAIAITDHHDFAFFPYVRKASQDELDDQGQPVSAEKRIVVFPGIELTLTAPNCQALLLFDADFPENLLHSVLVALAITPNRPEGAKHAAVGRIPQNVVNDLPHLYQILNQHEHLKGRFIVLPNVKENGHGTILRSGFANFYKSMPCVGGYTDGELPQPGTGAHGIIEGKNRDYGFKSIGVFQTSDNRKRNHADIGTYSTWVKWATPTAEALRQACLARESRISQTLPLMPAVYVTSIDVSSSKFMGQFYLDFNPQYNAIIGGRGTGKSTILEYLRWGLCDLIIGSEEDDLPKFQEKRKKLIEKTLIDATVQINFTKNGINHSVRRKINTSEIFLKIGAGEFEVTTEDNVRDLLPVQAYSQKQLSTVGVRIEELKRLVHSPIRQELNDFNLKFDSLKADIKRCYEQKMRKKQAESEIEKNELELKSLLEQVESLRNGLKGISDQDKETISIHKQYEIIEQLVEEWKGEIVSARTAVESIKQDISTSPAELPADVALPDKEQAVIADIHSEMKKVFEDIKLALSAIDEQLDPKGKALTNLNAIFEKSKVLFAQHKQKYETAKQKSTSQETTLVQIQKIEERVKEIRRFLTEKKQSISKAGDPEEQFSNFKKNWFDAHKERADLLAEQCSKLSVLSDNNLKSTLGRGRGTSGLELSLKKMLEGSGTRKEKIEDLCRRIAEAADPVEEWSTILSEFEKLAEINPSSASAMNLTGMPILSGIFTENVLRKMTEKITNENWIDLLLTQLDDLPLFEYKTRDGEYIEFNDASAGQQATALMHVLLNQDGPPLVIDQPEDDLDNQMVSDIAALIWQAKKKRQLIFASHNANIVVNGDAELVVCCDYKITTDQSKGEIKHLGAIDISNIRNEITKVMEGGEAAFKLRKEKYGF